MYVFRETFEKFLPSHPMQLCESAAQAGGQNMSVGSLKHRGA
jgi:hypothetical protein